LLIAFIVIGKQLPKWLYHFFYFSVLLGFIVHTVGLAARWYISGHAPMSNGYESMVFISWVTILSGFIFNKRSQFVLTATAVLAGLTLMVANLSFMDPEVSNLVPVLQSYWLTIHVSVITASYGFLGLGALLGTIVQILFVFANNQNKMRIAETINNITVINHKTLIVGLYLLTIGTFLGAVWANESWGRYWGWDPKETWALISMLVYAIVIHARMVPGMKGVFAFNLLALYAFASIIMTYFGVNYYLSGLHSYAGGDPVPVPSFAYYTVASFVMLSLLASIRFDKIYKQQNKPNNT
jgi:cytochrome c-type biogenesis protein CcsB